VSFFGGGTDYPEWFMKYGGAVLATTINKYCYVIMHKDKAWHCMDLPEGAGLGSSSAYTVGWLRAATNHTVERIAELAVSWEREKLNENVGYQDQWLCSLGGFRWMEFSAAGVRSELIEPPINLISQLMLFDTGLYRSAGGIVAEQLARIKEHENILTEMMDIAEFIKCKLGDGSIDGFGEALGESWKLKKQLSNRISNPVIDDIYDRAIEAGATGGKLLGAGGGGFMLFFVKLARQENVRQALGELRYVPFRFEEPGTTIIYQDS